MDNVTDTTADVHFTIDPHGDDTHYVIHYDLGSDPHQTASFDAGSVPGGQSLTRTLTGLTPGVAYTIYVTASNSGGSVTGESRAVDTVQQISGPAGTSLELDDEITSGDCPDSAQIQWGDGSSPTTVGSSNIHCQDAGGDQVAVTMTANHTYANSGHFHIRRTTAPTTAARPTRRSRACRARSTLALNVTGSGEGHATGSGLDCPGACSIDVDPGTRVTLTEEPIGNSGFAGWSGGGCSGTATTCAVAVNADATVGAAFALAPDLSDLFPDAFDDTSITFEFSVNPHGYDTHFVISYDDGTHQVDLPAEDVGASEDPTSFTRTVSGLKPNTAYTVDVRVSSVGGTGSSDAPLEFTTLRQLTQTAGSELTYTVSDSYPFCPGPVRVDWGDNSAADSPAIKCTPNADGGSTTP